MTVVESIASSVGSSLTLQVLVTVVILLAYPISSIVYNVYFHPLSKFPGPKSWAATYVPYIKALLNSTLIQSFADIHLKYGEVVRVGPNEISFATEKAWRDIYEYRPGHKETTKDPTWYIAPAGAPQNVVTTIDPAVRARMRKCLSNSFTEAALGDQSPLIESYADLCISRLRDMASAPNTKAEAVLVDITDWVNFFTVDVIGDLAFGESFGCLEKSDYHPWVRNLFNFLKGMTLAGTTRIYPWVGSFVERFLIPQSIMDKQKQHVDFANEKINRRLNLETSRPDLMTPFLKHNPDFMYMSKGEIESTFTILIVAGSETTATTLLEGAIRKRFQSENDISINTTKDIPYLDMVIEEGLRLCLPVPGALPRIVPKGGGTFAGHFLPEGTKVSIRPAILHRSAKYLEAPEEFHPERWLPIDERPKRFVGDNHEAVKPFSTGPTGCPGKMLAWAELRLLLARLIWAFDISLDPDRVLDWTKLKAMVIVEKAPMFLRLKARSL